MTNHDQNPMQTPAAVVILKIDCNWIDISQNQTIVDYSHATKKETTRFLQI